MCSLPLIITVTPPLPFPGPLGFVFSAKCASDERYYVRLQRLQESAPTPPRAEGKRQGRRMTSRSSVNRVQKVSRKREGSLFTGTQQLLQYHTLMFQTAGDIEQMFTLCLGFQGFSSFHIHLQQPIEHFTLSAQTQQISTRTDGFFFGQIDSNVKSLVLNVVCVYV